jgi:hypothetical protein
MFVFMMRLYGLFLELVWPAQSASLCEAVLQQEVTAPPERDRSRTRRKKSYCFQISGSKPSLLHRALHHFLHHFGHLARFHRLAG